ncbi:Gfo/Idh/MocA family protein [Nitrosophilus kaiyonis]|uniref:Gfo/Idh/MocA family protein n=1 Tax=Nitrosophilus kaiyonis TaxID=2930200 RepID=UPI0024911157|nr:Gfo/Idh/MocA family oxidoreductase [Nitrosophilus kaiyonis]
MVNIAIIGLGSMGKNHYRILKNMSNVNITALCDIEKNSCYNEPFYIDIDEMLKNENIDAVIIAVPTFLHKNIALKVAQYNKDMFIEKPAASTIEDAKEILEIVEKKNLKSCIGHVERFNPAILNIKNELKKRTIYTIEITRVGPFPPRISDVGVLTDLAVHDIDLIRYITGKNILEKSIFKSQKIHNHYEDNAVLSFLLEDEIIASITTNWLTPFKRRKVEVACEKIYYEADLIAQTLQGFYDYQTDNSYRVRDFHIKKDEPLLKELEAFIKYLKSGDRGNLASIEDSIETLKVALPK